MSRGLPECKMIYEAARKLKERVSYVKYDGSDYLFDEMYPLGHRLHETEIKIFMFSQENSESVKIDDCYISGRGKARVLIVDGQATTYDGLHSRIRRKYGSARECIKCKSPDEKYSWALIHGRPYSENIDDYMSLCSACHISYDGHTPDGIERIRAANVGRPSPKSRKVLKIDRAKNVVAEYDSVWQAAKVNKMSRNTIHFSLKNIKNEKRKFIWKYKK